MRGCHTRKAPGEGQLSGGRGAPCLTRSKRRKVACRHFTRRSRVVWASACLQPGRKAGVGLYDGNLHNSFLFMKATARLRHEKKCAVQVGDFRRGLLRHYNRRQSQKFGSIGPRQASNYLLRIAALAPERKAALPIFSLMKNINHSSHSARQPVRCIYLSPC